LVYLHPLVALGLLDRELARSRPAWLSAYRTTAACIPVLLAALVWKLHDAPDLPGDDPLTAALARQAGGGVLPKVSTRLLVAAHTYLELVHYGVWVVLIPLVGLRVAPWRLADIPAARRGQGWARAVRLILATGLVLVAALWVGLAADHLAVRTIYFTAAMVHVLAELPFLLRML
jgi:hypothetical protein